MPRNDQLRITFTDGQQIVTQHYDYLVGRYGELDLFHHSNPAEIVMTYAPGLWESVSSKPISLQDDSEY